MFKNLDVKKHGKVLVVILNAPETRNAITGEETIKEIIAVCDMANTNPDIQVMIITGTDPAFSSGGNIKDMATKRGMFSGSGEVLAENYRKHVQQIPLAVSNIRVPIIAAVNGPAVGAGCDLTLMCDLRIASERATFAESFINVGLIPGDGGAFFLPKIVGPAMAAEMSLTGEAVAAEKALEIGLVSRVVPHEELMSTAMEMAEKIAQKPPHALRMTKQLLKLSASGASLQNVLEQSAVYQSLCHQSEDHQEALSAILEKRTPVYKGR